MKQKKLVNLTLLAIEQELGLYKKLSKCDRKKQAILENKKAAREISNHILRQIPNIYAAVTEETALEKCRQMSKSSEYRKQITKLIEQGMTKISAPANREDIYNRLICCRD
ncbi:MAG: hypothetical protein QNJ38_11985 [Prochloraceae cyanobacterium]|nr:hypothetical protein [Prochloraceae cyanobacterium]